MQQSNITSFKHLSNFSSLKQFNSNMEQWWIDIHQNKLLSKSEILSLKRLVRFCCKIPGISNAKIQTIVAATHENDGMGISRSTFKRMIKKCIEMGLLTVIQTERKNGSKSSNLYIFNQYNPVINLDEASISHFNEPSKVEKLDCPKTSNLSKTINQNNKERNNACISDLPVEFVSSKVPNAFTSFVSYFYSSAKTIEELYRVSQQVTKYLTYYSEQDKLELSIEAFRQVIRNIKLGKRKIGNVFGYYNRVLHGILDKRYFEELFEDDKKGYCNKHSTEK